MIREHQEISNLSISFKKDILSAIKKMDKVKTKLLIVLKDDKYFSLLSIGDIQRAIIKGKKIDTPVKDILRPNTKVRVAHESDSFEKIKQIILKHKSEFMPVIDNNNNIVKIYFWKDVVGIEQAISTKKIDCPVVIMAGGKGTRLKPLTNVIPKALIPLGEKSIIEMIVNRFNKKGVNKFFITLNYKYELIQQYFEHIDNHNYRIDYVIEKEYLGTAGSLSLLRNKINQTFFVSNCDILIDQDYTEVYDYHIENKNELTIVAGLKHYPIPYGTLESGEDGLLVDIQEKPELTFLVNSGMYVLEPHLLKEIPQNTFFHITELIEKIKNENRKVGVFPVSEKSWLDIGQWNDYIKMLDDKS